MQIESDKIASAIFGGFANEEFTQAFLDLVGRAIGAAKTLIKDLTSFLTTQFSFKQWFQDDPIGATAGVLLGVVVLVVAGAAVGGVVGGIAALVKGVLGSKLAAIFGTLTLGALVGNTMRFALRGNQYIWNFNWNVTDSQLRAQQQAIFDSLAGQAGGTAGAWLASYVCGAAPVELSKRLKQIKVRPDILARLKEISDGSLWGDDPPEIFEEAVEQLKGLLTVSGQQGARASFIESYKNIRKWIRNSANVVGLKEIWPGLGDAVEKWGQEGSNSWSFAEKFEEIIENIDNNALRNFAEEFVDEAMDVCTENLMIVSYAFG